MKTKTMRAVCAAAVAFGCGQGAVKGAAQEAAGDVPPIEAFAQMPVFRDVGLSPSGDRFFARYKTADMDAYSFVVFDRTNGLNAIYAAAQTEELTVGDPVWMTEDRIVFSINFKARRYRTDTNESRLMALDLRTGEMERLFRDPREGMPVQFETNIVSYLPDETDAILVQYRRDEPNTSVYKVPTDKRGAHKRVQRGRPDIQSWDADRAGVIRSGWGIEDDERQKLIVRLPDDAWRDISHRVAEGAPTFYFAGFPNARDKAFVASDHETDTAALYIYDIPSDTFGERLFHDPASDVYGVVQQRGTGAALGVTFAGDDADTHWFGDNFVRGVFDQMKRTFPDQDVTLADLNRPQTHGAMIVEDGIRPGGYVIYNIAANRATRLPPQYPGLVGKALGRVVPVRYEARDGLEIPGYVTLPPGVASLEDAKGLPFVMFPHGGPSGRNFAVFDWWAQAVASRGYGVMQMNFRGSTGFGEAYRAAGDRQFGQAMQDDITDGAAWLIAEGHADPEKLAIMGGSYGGYAALMGAVKTPDLYQCAAAFAPVTDLPRMLAYADNYVGGAYRTRHIGNLWKDRSMLRENSPALHADRIEVPILLVHGEEDRVVDIDQSERMVKGMKRQKVAHRYVELPKGSHFLDVGDNRTTFLRELDAFLGDCLGG